jgi:hypothetical protein
VLDPSFLHAIGKTGSRINAPLFVLFFASTDKPFQMSRRLKA